MAPSTDVSLEARILADQLDDLKSGLFFSMPISSTLSALVLLIQAISENWVAAGIWFLVVNALNGLRVMLALRPHTAGVAANRQLRQLSILALMSGLAWAFLAVLTHGYTASNAPLHLIILTGISAGAVVYGTSHWIPTISFTAPTLLVTAGALVAKGDVEDHVLALAVLLFLVGLTRSSLLGQSRFREASRLKHQAEKFAAEMEHSSQIDPLTGLLNRRGLEYAVQQLTKQDAPYLTMLVDLDGFKAVNDTYGHKIGDDVLVKIARKIEEVADASTRVARIGGDEFVLLSSVRSQSFDVCKMASRIIAHIATLELDVASVQVGACIGIYLSDKPSLTEMLLRADTALYSAKRRGRNEFCLFDAELELELKRRHCVERDLRAAIETGDLSAWFQPIVDIDTRSVIGFEALLRWHHPEHGAIMPPEIITVARETGMLQSLTETVFSGCCGLIADLEAAGRSDVRVAMNVSPRELEAGSLDDMILLGLKAKGLPSTMFEIEITEEAPVNPQRVDAKLGRLSRAGISIALDDFGTGFSTLASLKDRRIGKVKIDKAFIRGLAKSPEDQMLVKAVIDLSRLLEFDVMAEGVERETDRATLQSLGCKTAQGYLFSKAIPHAQAIELTAAAHAGTQRKLASSY